MGICSNSSIRFIRPEEDRRQRWSKRYTASLGLRHAVLSAGGPYLNEFLPSLIRIHESLLHKGERVFKKGKKHKMADRQVREIVGAISNREVIAEGSSVKIRKRLEKLYGRGNWKKLKGIADVRLSDGAIVRTEIH
jgi:hypothetical protein